MIDDTIKAAQKQMRLMNQLFLKETIESVKTSTIYTGPLEKTNWSICGDRMKNKNSHYVQVVDATAADAVIGIQKGIKEAGNNRDNKVAVLNFASYRNPGGGFIKGSSGQEESLCHSSNLYNILINNKFKDYYADNDKNPNNNLYTDKAIYTPNVLFTNDGDENDRASYIAADVLSCAAPNWAAAQRKGITEIENILIFAQRMQFVKDILEKEGVTIVVFGSWGCGVFKQDPKIVAQLFNFIFKQTTSIINIMYAVPKSNKENYDTFNEVIKKGWI